MQAANHGTPEAGGINVGLNISLPHEQANNPYITLKLDFEFHYFFMPKYWLVYLAKAIIIFPGGFGILDEVLKLMTLVQTKKLKKSMPNVLFVKAFLHSVLNLDPLVKHGTIDANALNLFIETKKIYITYMNVFISPKLLSNYVSFLCFI